MLHRYNLESVDQTQRNITHRNLTFEKKAVLSIGDFHQTLPVLQSINRFLNVGACFKRQRLYTPFKTFHLYKDMLLFVIQRYVAADTAVLHFPSFHLELGEQMLRETSIEPIPLPQTVRLV